MKKLKAWWAATRPFRTELRKALDNAGAGPSYFI